MDVWLNTPQRPQEASGTSGMKAALNGVPSLSVLDGWWVEGHAEGLTGWAIGHGGELLADSSSEIASMYDKLELLILPLYYGKPTAFAEVMRSAIALNGSFFNAQRWSRNMSQTPISRQDNPVSMTALQSSGKKPACTRSLRGLRA